MKKLSKAILKLLYVIIFPLIIIIGSIFLKLNVLLVIFLTAISVLQSILWFSVMQNVKLSPSILIETYIGICFGVRYINETNSLMLIFPFITIELKPE